VLPTITNVQRLMADNVKRFNTNNSMVANLTDGGNAATWYQSAKPIEPLSPITDFHGSL
jgi:hypothetical protein